MKIVQLKSQMNTVTHLVCFMVFAVMMNRLPVTFILIYVSLLIFALVYVKSQHFFRMIKRMKWFILFSSDSSGPPKGFIYLKLS